MRFATGLGVVVLMTAGCASSGQKLTHDPDGCVLKTLSSSGLYLTWDRVRVGDPAIRTRANCASNRALEQMVAVRQDQQRNTATSFAYETPPAQ